MDAKEMLIKAHAASALSATTLSGEETAGTGWPENLSPAVETLKELDAGGREFSWSSIASGPSAPSSDAPSATFGGASGKEGVVAEETPALNQPAALIGTRTEHGSAPSMQKHSLYFWDSITFKVEGVVFQLPKYRFAEESEVFMEMVAKDGGDGPIDLNIALVDFESFLKAFLPRASAMYDDLPTLTKEEWISVLKLSTNWLFNDMRQLAISNLSLPFPSLGLITDPIERICLAKEYRVYDWLVEGYEKVIDRLITSDDDHGSPLTLTLQEGQRIGLDVALELSGIAIRRMRLAERRVPLKDMRCDVLDAFKQEFDCVREEGSRFIKKEQRLEEEAREKAKAAPEESHKKMEESKNISRSEKTDQKAEELDKRKGAEKPTPSPDSGLSKKVKVKHRKLKREDHEKAKQIGPDGKDTKPLAVEKTVGLKDGEGSAQEDAGRLDNENTKRLEEEEMRTLKEEIAKRRKEEEKLRVKQIWKQWDEAEERKVQALAEEEMRRRRMGPTEENAKAESSKIMPFPEKPKFLSWCE